MIQQQLAQKSQLEQVVQREPEKEHLPREEEIIERYQGLIKEQVLTDNESGDEELDHKNHQKRGPLVNLDSLRQSAASEGGRVEFLYQLSDIWGVLARVCSGGPRPEAEEEVARVVFFHPLGTCLFFFELLHLLFMMYNVTLLPIIVGFRLQPHPAFIVLEVISSLDYLVFMLIEMRTPQYDQGILEREARKVRASYLGTRKFYRDLISFLPFNLIIWLTDGNEVEGAGRVVLDLLRVLRLLSLGFISELLQKVEIRYRNLQRLLVICKSVILLLFIWHFVACIWFWFCVNQFAPPNPGEPNWIGQNRLDVSGQDSFARRYFYSLFFFISIASTAGYAEMMIYNIPERIFFILTIYVGDILFAIGFGMMASQTSIFAASQVNLFLEIK